MENEDAKIIALALGIPSATFVSLAILIAVSFHYNLVERIRRQRRHPTLATIPTNNDDAIPLEQLPPRIHAPIPRHAISVDDLISNNQHEEEVVDEPPSFRKTRREDLLPLPEGARLASLSPPPTLPNILHTSLELPHPGTRRPCRGIRRWAETFDPSPPAHQL